MAGENFTGTDKSVINAPAPVPVTNAAPQEDWRAILEKYLVGPTAEIAGSMGQGSQGITPEVTAVLGNQAVPWLGLSSAMKGFSEGWAKTRPAPVDPKTQAEIAKLNAETGKLNAEAKGGGEVGKINKEWETRNRDIKSTVEQFNRGVAAFNANFGKSPELANPAADQSLIFAYLKSRAPSMRLTDAGVDEAANQGIIDAYTVSLWNKFKGGTALLEDTERIKYMKATELGVKALSTQFKQDRTQFARDYGVGENDLQDFTAAVDKPVESDAKEKEYIKRAKQVLADPKSLPADKERANRILNIK